MQSGALSRHFQVELLDAMVLGWSVRTCLDYIADLNPDGILVLCGSVSFGEDLAFLSEVRKVSSARILASGDLFLEHPEFFLERFSCLDGVLLNFSSGSVPSFFMGENTPLSGIVQRADHGGFLADLDQGRLKGPWHVPVPRHDLFLGLPYTYPFVYRERFATLLTDFACPFGCDFCVSAPLVHRVRPIDSIVEELRLLQRLGTRELYISDQTFGPNKERALALCDVLGRWGPWGWVCFLRADLADPKLLDSMKSAGCHTIMFGVESGSDEILRKHRKGFGKERVREAVAGCKRRGIDTVATFILGLPEDNQKTIQDTINFALSLDCTFASFNRFVPRFSTFLRRDCLEMDLVDESVLEMDQSGSAGVMGTETLSSKQVDLSLKKAVASFYLRPKFLCRRLFRVRSWWDVRRELGGGLRVVRGIF